jgi:TonB family protein
LKPHKFWPYLKSFAAHLLLFAGGFFLWVHAKSKTASTETAIEASLFPNKSTSDSAMNSGKGTNGVSGKETPSVDSTKNIITENETSGHPGDERAEKNNGSAKNDFALGDQYLPGNLNQNVNETLTGANQTYFSMLRSQISAHQIYPILARKQQLEGVVEVALELNADGSIRQIIPISGLNHAVLVEAALQSIQAAAPFSAVPKGYPQRVIVPIEFSLSKKK